jgi:hypothetical protein
MLTEDAYICLNSDKNLAFKQLGGKTYGWSHEDEITKTKSSVDAVVQVRLEAD